jgi:hypothetical protein
MRKKRSPLKTKEIEMKRLKESYEQTNRTVASSDKVRELEKLLEREILPRVYEDKR